MSDLNTGRADETGDAWHAVAKLSELEPEYPFQVKIGRTEFALCLIGGQVFAVDNICSHAFARLSDGEVEDFDILCPLHGGRFDVRTGQPTAAPCSVPIRVVPAKVEGDDVMILWSGER